MTRIYTNRIVAGVTNHGSFWDWATVNHPCRSMASDNLAVDSHDGSRLRASGILLIDGADPFPAPARHELPLFIEFSLQARRICCVVAQNLGRISVAFPARIMQLAETLAEMLLAASGNCAESRCFHNTYYRGVLLSNQHG